MQIRAFREQDEQQVVALWQACGLTRPWAGCPKVNLQVRTGNAEVLAFYRALGYAQDEVLALGKRLIPDA